MKKYLVLGSMAAMTFPALAKETTCPAPETIVFDIKSNTATAPGGFSTGEMIVNLPETIHENETLFTAADLFFRHTSGTNDHFGMVGCYYAVKGIGAQGPTVVHIGLFSFQTNNVAVKSPWGPPGDKSVPEYFEAGGKECLGSDDEKEKHCTFKNPVSNNDVVCPSAHIAAQSGDIDGFKLAMSYSGPIEKNGVVSFKKASYVGKNESHSEFSNRLSCAYDIKDSQGKELGRIFRMMDVPVNTDPTAGHDHWKAVTMKYHIAGCYKPTSVASCPFNVAE